MKGFIVKQIYLLFILLGMISCLPAEKTTQCADDEAYDATARTCVAKIGASSSTVKFSSISPSSSYTISQSAAARTHAITVADPYNNGYQVRWLVTLPSGSQISLGTGLSQTFNQSAYSTGVHILEVQLFDSTGNELFDSRSWSVNIVSETTPTISSLTSTPMTTTTSSPATTINATVSNPDSIANVNYAWYVNGTAVAGQSGVFSTTSQPLSFSFDPTNASSYYVGNGVYNVQLILSENLTSNTYNSFTWTITNNLPNFASIALGTSPTFTTVTPSKGSFITTINNTSITSSGFNYDSDADGTTDQIIDFCLLPNDINGVDGDGVFVDFLLDGALIPGASNIAFTSTTVPKCLSDEVDYSISIPTSTPTESHTLTAVVYDKYTGGSSRPAYNGFTQVDSFNWTLRVRQTNTPPTLTIANTSTIGCTTQTTTQFSNCTIQQGTSVDLTLAVSDDDFTSVQYDKFQVDFYLDGTLLDGTHSLSSSDCSHDFTETNTAAKFTCSLVINSYDSNGPIDPTTISNYQVTAVVRDQHGAYGTNPNITTSNTVSFLIDTINDNTNNAPTIAAFGDTNAAGTSFVTLQSTPSTPVTLAAGTVNENDDIIFNIEVTDQDRDNLTLSINRCSDLTCSIVFTPTLQTKTHNKNNDSLTEIITIPHEIGQDELTGTNQGNIFYRVVANDGTTTTSAIFALNVVNNNPDPSFNTANFSPLTTASLTTMAGFPLTINPGTISDASTADGNNISYQWQISTDGGTTFANLDGATTSTLIWTPGSELNYDTQNLTTTVNLRLCIGDDGVNNAGASKAADCNTAPAITAGNWTVNVISNFAQGEEFDANATTNSSLGELATWTDPRSVNPVIQYVAYVNSNREIVVDKIITASTGEKNGSTQKTTPEIVTLKFPATTDPSLATNGVTDLSITGDTTNDYLYIAYLSPMSSVDSVHVRRIDIGTGKTGFSGHQGKLGFDSEYNGFLDDITVSSDVINSPTENSDGLVQLEFTGDGASSTSMQIDFTGINSTNVSLQRAVDFCNPLATCSTVADTITSVVNAINTSTSPALQGITASASGTIVTLAGTASQEYIQVDINASAIGKIVVNQTSGYWEIPFLDSSRNGADQNKVSIFKGNLNTRLGNITTQSQYLAFTQKATRIVNDMDYNNNTSIIVTKNESDSRYSIYELDSNYGLLDVDTDLFGEALYDKVQVSISNKGSSNDNSAFIIGENQSGNLAYARVDAVSNNYDFSNIVVRNDLDSAFTLLTNVEQFSIQAGINSNELFIGVLENTTYNPYLVRVTGATPSADCSFGTAQNTAQCMKVLPKPQSHTAINLPISLSGILQNVTIGTDGATASEATNDILTYSLHIDDGSGFNLPVTGLINTSPISLSVDETTPGINYNIPYVSN